MSVAGSTLEALYVLVRRCSCYPLAVFHDAAEKMKRERICLCAKRDPLICPTAFVALHALDVRVEWRARDSINNEPDFLLSRRAWAGDQIVNQPVGGVWIIALIAPLAFAGINLPDTCSVRTSPFVVTFVHPCFFSGRH